MSENPTTTLTGVVLVSAGPAAGWAGTDQIIPQGIYLLETDTGLVKMSDGVHLYDALPYHLNALAKLTPGNGLTIPASTTQLAIQNSDNSIKVGTTGVSVNTSQLLYPVDNLGNETSPGTVTLNRGLNKWFELQVGAALTIAINNWPAGNNYAEMNIQLINGGAFAVTWPTINWMKTDGSGTFANSPTTAGVTFQTSGNDFITLWSTNGGSTLFAKVMR